MQLIFTHTHTKKQKQLFFINKDLNLAHFQGLSSLIIMEAIEAVEKEIEKVISKFSGVKKQSESTLDEIISVLEICSSSLWIFINSICR